MDGALKRFEKILVVDDVAVFLALVVEAVDAADRLEQAVVSHALVDVEVRRRGGVEASEKLVDDDQQLHLAGLLDEALLYLLLEQLDFGHGSIGVLAEVFSEHLP